MRFILYRTKKNILNSIIKYKSIGEIERLIHDYNNIQLKLKDEVVKLKNAHILNVLNLLETKKISKQDIHLWSDFLELNEALKYSRDIATVLNWLASPEINGEIDSKMIQEIKNLLNNY